MKQTDNELPNPNIQNIILLPVYFFWFLTLFIIKIIWDAVVIIAAITLTIMWISFVFGSVVGVILLLIFMGIEGFFIPMALLAFCVNPMGD